MPQLHPDLPTLKRWTKLVPAHGDLLFFGDHYNRPLVEGFAAALFLPEEVKAQSLDLWNLHHRSWYVYTLGNAKLCAFFPAGRLESLSPYQLEQLAATQLKIGNPTLLRAQHKGLLQVGRHTWVTSASYHQLFPGNQAKVLADWLKENKLSGMYPKITPLALPRSSREFLQDRGLDSLVNQFPDFSGPNCFAAAAYAVSAGQEPGVLRLWLHSEPFFRYLKHWDYRPRTSLPEEPGAGDVLVAHRGKEAVHAAVSVGNGYLFEKPGQDCYEPYRLVRTKSWLEDWKDATIWVRGG